MSERLLALDQLLNKEKAIQNKRCKEIEQRLKKNQDQLKDAEEDQKETMQSDDHLEEQDPDLSDTSLSVVLNTVESVNRQYKKL